MQSGQIETGPGSFGVPKGILGFGFHPETEKGKRISPAEKVVRSREMLARTEAAAFRSVSIIRRAIPLGAMNVPPDISEARGQHRKNVAEFLNKEIENLIAGGVSGKGEKGGMVNFLTALEKMEMFGACTDVRIKRTEIGENEFEKFFSDFFQWRGQNGKSSFERVKGTEADFGQINSLYPDNEKKENTLGSIILELVKELSAGKKERWNLVNKFEIDQTHQPEISKALTTAEEKCHKIIGEEAKPRSGETIGQWMKRILGED